jgi:hypothetical protein
MKCNKDCVYGLTLCDLLEDSRFADFPIETLNKEIDFPERN